MVPKLEWERREWNMNTEERGKWAVLASVLQSHYHEAQSISV
jgi:hypothetical protein